MYSQLATLDSLWSLLASPHTLLALLYAAHSRHCCLPQTHSRHYCLPQTHSRHCWMPCTRSRHCYMPHTRFVTAGCFRLALTAGCPRLTLVTAASDTYSHVKLSDKMISVRVESCHVFLLICNTYTPSLSFVFSNPSSVHDFTPFAIVNFT